MQMRLGEKFLHLVSGDFPMPFDSGVDIVISSSFGYFAAQKTIAYDMRPFHLSFTVLCAIGH